MLLFLPDSAYSAVHCVCRRAAVWGMFGRCWREKMLGSHLRAVADARSLGLCSTIAVKPRGPRFFSWSPRIKHSAHDCQNPSRHGEGEHTERLCYSLLARKKDKKHFALTLRTNVFTQHFLVSYLHLSTLRNVSYLLTIHEQRWALREACYRTTCFMSLHAYSAWDSMSYKCFLEIKEQKHETGETKYENNV